MGVVICKLERHASHAPATHRGYIAMLAVASAHRCRGIATALVRTAIDAMAAGRADEVVLETEETNRSAMRLYERLGFLRSKKLHRYYLNGNSAYRLVLLLNTPPPEIPDDPEDPDFDPVADDEPHREREHRGLPSIDEDGGSGVVAVGAF